MERRVVSGVRSKMLGRFAALFAVFAISFVGVLSALPQAQANDVVESGTWGGAPYVLYADGTLAIEDGSTMETPGGFPGDKKNEVKKIKGKNIVLKGSMSEMFWGMVSLTDIGDLATWNTDDISSMRYMFSWATSLSDVSALANWNISKVTNMEGMFNNAESLVDISALSTWNTSNVTTMFAIFENCSSLKTVDVSGWNIEKIIDDDYKLSFKYSVNLSSLTVGEKTRLSSRPLSSQLLSQNWYNQNTGVQLIGTDMISLINEGKGAGTWRPVIETGTWGGAPYVFYADGTLAIKDGSTIEAPGGFPSEKKNEVKKIEGKNIVLKGSMQQMFWGMVSLTDISDLATWDTSGVTSMNAMFSYATSLSDASALANWDTSKVTNISGLFRGASSLSILDVSGWDMTKSDWELNLTEAPQLTRLTVGEKTRFARSSLHSDLLSQTWVHETTGQWASGADMVGLINAGEGAGTWVLPQETGTWGGAQYLVYGDGVLAIKDGSTMTNPREFSGSAKDQVKKIVGKNITVKGSAYQMFWGMTSLSDISALASWDTKDVTDMYAMFSYTTSLSDVSALAEWDTGKVESMRLMFNGDSNLKDVSGLAKWNTGNVTTMSGMFQNVSGLEDVSALSAWNTSKVTTMQSIFAGATSLSIVDMSNWDMSSISGEVNNPSFSDSPKLTSLTVGEKTRLRTLSTRSLSQYWSKGDRGAQITGRTMLSRINSGQGAGTWRVLDVVEVNEPNMTRPEGYVTVTYSSAHGSLTGTTAFYVNPDVKVTLTAPTVTEENGWTFDGWDAQFEDVQFTSDTTIAAEFSKIPDVIPVEDPEVPNGDPNYVRVTFVTGDNGAVQGQSVYDVRKGVEVTLTAPTPFADDGYAFVKWDKDFENVAFYEDTTITSQLFEKIIYGPNLEDPSPEGYVRVVFDPGQHGSLNPGHYAVFDVLKGVEISLRAPEAIPNPNYTFAGWSAEFVNIAFTEDTVLYAQWKADKCTLTFHGNGATGGSMDALTGLDYDSLVILPPNAFTREGYTFKEWSTDPTGTGTVYRDEGVLRIQGDRHLYAQWKAEFVPVYRLFNRATGEHLYSTDKGEYDALVARGWIGENIAWYAPSESSTPVYRLFNPVSGDHHYTASEVEISVLTSQRGWVLEGDAQTGDPVVLFYSDDLERVPLMRLHKPGLAVGGHLHTSDQQEYAILQTRGWIGEGISFYGAQLP